jgi:hypothetical protein
MSVLNLALLVDLQQEVGELVLFITSCATIIILKNALSWRAEKCGYDNFDHRSDVCPVHLNALECGEFYEGGRRVRRPPMKWSAISEILKTLLYRVFQ